MSKRAAVTGISRQDGIYLAGLLLSKRDDVTGIDITTEAPIIRLDEMPASLIDDDRGRIRRPSLEQHR